MIRSCIRKKLILIIILNSVFKECKTIKKTDNCKRCQNVKRCVFKVRSTGKQEMLQSRTLLSEQTLKIMLKNGLDRPCPVNLINYSTTFGQWSPHFRLTFMKTLLFIKTHKMVLCSRTINKMSNLLE